jgi:hypothetical protein
MTWLTKLLVEEAGHDLSKRAVWELQRPLWYRSAEFGSIVVPPGFRTNYASVPRLPVVFWLAGERVHKEAALHDWLYTTHETTREVADDVFLEALLLNPLVPEGLAQSMHRAVRWFGQGSWEDTTNILQLPEISAQVRPV